MRRGNVFFLPICGVTSKFLVIISKEFAFATISTWIDPFAAFAFTFMFAFGHVEATQYVYMLFQLLSLSDTAYCIYEILAVRHWVYLGHV